MIFASNNKGKIKEIKTIFKDYEILSLKDVNINIEIDEDGHNYYENALKKAKTIFELTGIPTIADDSGLEILGLDRWPNINTQRIHKDDLERNKIFIEKTKDLADKNVESVCTLVYIDENGIVESTGRLKGTITNEIHKGNGFGYDNIFRLENGKVVSELSEDEKNRISARSIAAKELLEKINFKGS